MQLTNKTVLITGAKGGLGHSVTEAFLNAGARVAGASRSISDSDFTSDAFVGIPAELTSGDSAQTLVAEVLRRFERIDAVVHLVGGFAGGSPVEETDESVVEKMMALNYWTSFHLLRAVLPTMRMQGTGCFLATGSRVAVEPGPNVAAYAASKAALVALVRAAAAENNRYGIRANVILPSTMDTKANRDSMPGADFSKWVDTAQVASLLVHLASDAASQVSGALIPIYGGEL